MEDAVNGNDGKILDQRIYGKGIGPQRKAKGTPRIMVQYVPE